MKLPALTIWEPWASLWLRKFKRCETRSWQTNHRGLLAIHAAKRWSWDQQSSLQSLGMALWNAGHQSAANSVASLREKQPATLGHILGVVQLTRVVKATDAHREEFCPNPELEAALGHWAPDRWAWVAGETWTLPEPIPAAGSQSLWQVDEAAVNRILEQLPQLRSAA